MYQIEDAISLEDNETTAMEVAETSDDGINIATKNTTNSSPGWVLISVMTFSQFSIAAFNNLNVFMIEFAQTNYGLSANASTLMQVVGKGVQVLMTPFAALLADVKGVRIVLASLVLECIVSLLSHESGCFRSSGFGRVRSAGRCVPSWRFLLC